MSDEALDAFAVLGLSPGATSAEVERAAAHLLSQLAIGSETAKRYRAGAVWRERDESRVRLAAAELRDPRRRLSAELWWSPPDAAAGVEPLPPWPQAMRSIGWRAG